TGAVVSNMVRVAVHTLLLVAASVTVKVMAWLPGARAVPASGLCVTLTAVQSVKVICAVRSGTSAVQLVPAESVRLVAQAVMNGAIVSTMVTTAVQVAVLVAPSRTVKVMT